MKGRMERVLELLVDEIEERMRRRQKLSAAGEAQKSAPPPPPVAPRTPAARVSPAAPPPSPPERVEASAAPKLEPEPEKRLQEPGPGPEVEPEADRKPPPLPPPSHAARLMLRLALSVLVLVVIVNIPIDRYGMTLATAMPDSASLTVRNGLVIKEEDAPEIYVYQDGEFRWISSMEAFEAYGFTWGDVHIVEDGYLDWYEVGSPIHLVMKCRQSPHVYRLEEGEKRWIRDIETFEAEGHKWEDVRFVSCAELRRFPDGETIPPGSGSPPQP